MPRRRKNKATEPVNQAEMKRGDRICITRIEGFNPYAGRDLRVHAVLPDGEVQLREFDAADVLRCGALYHLVIGPARGYSIQVGVSHPGDSAS